MMLTDKRFWIYAVIIALMPVMMTVFTGLVLFEGKFSGLFHSDNTEIFLVWELAYISGGLLAYHKIQDLNWIQYSFFSWVIVCPLLNGLSFIWAGVRIHDGFTGVAYFMISLIAWGFSIIPLLAGVWLYRKYYHIKAQ